MGDNGSKPDEIMNAIEAAAYVGLSVPQFNRRVVKGLIHAMPSIKDKGRKYSRIMLDEYLASRNLSKETIQSQK